MQVALCGTVDDRFVIEHRAGVGGMGEVYKAQDLQSGLSVAVKIMRGGSDDDVTRFMREARILSELEHPRIVRHLAHGIVADGIPWLAMEWLDGEDLSKRLVRGCLTLDETMCLALDVAEGLAFAHGRGVVHRDLKPSNLFLRQGRAHDACILDFGIAKAGMTTRVTRTGMLMGTPGYMAPEQARGAQNIDARADVYSLGSVLFECLTGEPVYSGAHVAALLAKILFEDAPRLRERLPGVPKAVDELLARMLAKAPEDRFDDGRAVVAAIRTLGDLSQTVKAPLVPSNWPPPRSLTGAEKRSVAVILVGAATSETAMQNVGMATTQIMAEPALRNEAEKYGARCEALLDGSVALLLTQKTLATDLAAQAARCALALRACVPGRTIALAIGRADATDKSPMGHVIDRAASLFGATNAWNEGIRVDETVAGLLDARFDVREEDDQFILYDERDLAEGTRTLLGKATPFVGRDREMRYIEDSFNECLEGSAQVVLVTAPAGVGKSRLAHEFLRTVHHRCEDVAIWIARGDFLRAGSALGMLAQAMRGACGVLEGEPLEVRREKVRRYVSAHMDQADRKRIAEFLGELIGASFPDSDSLPLRAARLDALLMTEQMRAAFLDCLGAECAKRPVVMLFEDLHWGDRPTIQFLDAALRELQDKPVFVLALGRPEVRDVFPDVWAHRKLVEVHLKALGRKPIERLVRHTLGDQVSVDTVERLVRLSEGNAFYLEELIRFNAEGRPGVLPETVVAMVQSRLGTLDETSRRVLRAASILGEVAWTGGVALLLGERERTTATQETLLRLVDAEILVRRKESRFLNQEEFAFRHALLREGAYGMLTEDDKGLGHKLAAEWLEACGEDDALLLADHFEKGGDNDRAAFHYHRAAVRSYLAGDSMAAISAARRGLAPVVSASQRASLLGIFCESHFWLLDMIGTALPYANEVCALAATGTQPWIQGVIVKLNAALTGGNVDEFVAMLSACMTIEPQNAEETSGVFFALGTGAIGLDFMGRVKEGNDVLARLHFLAQLMKARLPDAVFIAPNAMPAMRDCYAYENPLRGLRHSEVGASMAESIGDRRFREMNRVLFSSMNRWFLGETAEAERELLTSSLPDEAFGYVSSLRPFILAWMYADARTYEQARVYAEKLIHAGKTRRLLLDEGRGHWVLGEILRRMGDWEAANIELTTARNQLQMLCALDVPGVLASLAALRHAEGRNQEALVIAEEALDLYDKTGACSQFFRGAFLRLNHAEILQSLGRYEDAALAIRKAVERIRVNADKIDDPKRRATFLENVPENQKTLQLAREWCNDNP